MILPGNMAPSVAGAKFCAKSVMLWSEQCGHIGSFTKAVVSLKLCGDAVANRLQHLIKGRNMA